MYPNTFYRVSVKAVIRDANDRVLVVKENQDTWSLPEVDWIMGNTQ